MNGNALKGRSSWNNNPSVYLYQGYAGSRSSFSNKEPLRFHNPIYFPDTNTEVILKTDRPVVNHQLTRSRSSETRHSYKPKLTQSVSIEEYSWNRPGSPKRESIYKRNSKPTRNSEQRRRTQTHRRSNSMGNPYSVEDTDSSFESSGPSPYDGPITFTPKTERRPLPKIPSDLRREMIEVARDSRRDVDMNQSRRRSRSHDPSLDTRGYVQRYFSFELDPDSPDYRPAGRYKKYNPRERKTSSTSREFNIDNFNRNYSETDVDNNNVTSDTYGRHNDRNWNRYENKQNSLRNRNSEQKVVYSILKNNTFSNSRPKSENSGEGLRNENTDIDVFATRRNRSQSYGPAVANSSTNNTIYFYQTRL